MRHSKTAGILFALGLAFSWASPSLAVDIGKAALGKNATQFDLSKLRQFGVTDVTIEELRVFRTNLLTFILNASYRPDSEKGAALDSLRTYLKRIIPVLGAKISRDTGVKANKLGLPDYSKLENVVNFKIAFAPPWSVESEVEYLLKATENLPSLPITAQAIEARKFIEGLDLATIAGFSAPEIEQIEHWGDILSTLADENASQKQVFAVVDEFEKRFDAYVKKVRTVGDFISRSDQIHFPNKNLELFIREIFNGYFSNLETSAIRNMISDILKLKDIPSEMQLSKILFVNSGPAFGKFLQQLGREPGLGDTLKEIMTVLETQGKRVPQYMAEKIIHEQGRGYTFLKIDDKAWTGTIGQTQPATLLYEGKEQRAAIRFVKPGVQERTRQDIEIFRKIAPMIKNHPALRDSGMPDFDKITAGLQSAILEDSDPKGVIRRQLLAQDFYEKTVVIPAENGEKAILDFKVPRVFLSKAKDSDLLVTELVQNGHSFEEIYTSKADLSEALTKEIVKLWYSEALFKTKSFYHGDLHQGNFLVVLSETGDRVTIFILDFGMAGSLSALEQQAFLKVAAGTALNSPTTIARGLLSMLPTSKKEAQSTRKLAAMITQKMADIKTLGTPDLKAPGWIIWYLEQGNDLPGKLATFSRGAGLTNQLPKVIGKEEILKSALKDVVARSIRGSSMGWLPFRGTTPKTPQYRFPLTFVEFVRMSWDTFSDRCRRLLHRHPTFGATNS